MMSYRISIEKRDKRGERDGCRKRIKQKERGRGTVGSVVEALGKGDSVSYELQSERPLSSEAWAAVETVPRKYGNHLLTIALRLQIINLEFGVIVTKKQNLAASHSFLSASRRLIWNRGHSLFSFFFARERQPTSAYILSGSPHTIPSSHSTHRR